MSYGLDLAGDCLGNLRDLDPWIQEDVLDELERFANDPSLLSPRRHGEPVVHDFVRIHHGVKRYIFLTVYRDDAAEVISLLGVGEYAKPQT